jgi:hypothetical protein
MKVGRPTKLTPQTYSQIEEYIKSCGREQTQLPTLEGLARYLNVNTDTIQEWSKKNKDFSVSIKRILERQKEQLMNDGMYGGKEVNAAMAIFLLKVNHGMKENDPSTLVQVNVQPILGSLKAE